LADINKDLDSKGSPATNKTNREEPGKKEMAGESINKGSPLISRRDPDYNFKGSNTMKHEEDNYEEEEDQYEEENEGEEKEAEDKDGEEG